MFLSSILIKKKFYDVTWLDCLSHRSTLNIDCGWGNEFADCISLQLVGSMKGEVLEFFGKEEGVNLC